MRAILEPFELQPDIDESGWVPAIVNGYVYGAPILDLNLNGGAVSLQRNGGLVAIISPQFPIDALRAIVKCHIVLTTNTGTERWQFLETGGGLGIGVRMMTGTNQVGIYLGNALLATSVGVLAAGQAYLLEIDATALNAGGSCDVYIDGVLFVSFSGDTLAGTGFLLQHLQITLRSSSRCDNITVDVPSISYDTGISGAPAATETLTGTTSGATAIVAAVGGDATSGRCTVHTVIGTFQDNEQITSSGTLDALVNAPTADYAGGLEPFSSRPGNEHFVVCSPNANGNSSQLTGSDGNSVDNYLLVNDVPPDAADYVESTNTGATLLDTYGIDFSNIPIAGEIERVSSVGVAAQVISDLTGVDQANLVIRQGATDYEAPDGQGNPDDISLPLSTTTFVQTWDTQPDGSGEWDRAAAILLEGGIQFKP